jgi:two-component system NarL family response regulator
MDGIGRKTAVDKYSVLIICPQTLIREGLRLLLAQDDDVDVVGVAADANEVLASWLHLQPDVAVAMYSQASTDCAAEVQRLKAELPDLPLLVISPDTRPERVQAVLVAGATGYLPLIANLDELIWAIFTVGREELALHPAIVPSLFTYLAGQAQEDDNLRLDRFSPREQEVLACLVRGLSDRDIAQELFISVRTVQTHLAHIYAKLDVHSRTEAAVIAVRAGWFAEK